MSARKAPATALPESGAALARELVLRFGGHPAGELGVELGTPDESDLERWLVATCLLATRAREELALAAFRSLEKADLAQPRELAESDLLDVAGHLAGAELPGAEAVAQRLLRLSQALVSEYTGSVSSLANRCADLEELASRLWRLAPGFGRAAVHRFLQPLRDLWPAAADVPLDPAARAAAVHLGLIAPGQDEELGPGALLAALREDDAPQLRDVEAALARLGRQSCLREHSSRCPLGAQCPVAASVPDAPTR
jgi:hypothetical protein